MISILVRYFTRNIFIEKMHLDNSFTRFVFFDSPRLEKIGVYTDINWKKLYPFESNEVSIMSSGLLANIKNKIFSIEKKINTYTDENLINRIKFVEAATEYENTLGWQLDEIIDLGEGYLSGTLDKISTDKHVKSVYDLYSFLTELDIGFLYTQAPYKICRYDTLVGISDYSNENTDALLYALQENDVPYFDLRTVLHNEMLDHHSLFYKTDHHWKAETGLWAAGKISEYLNLNYGFEINTSLFLPEQYKYEIYKNWFLGSVGRNITLKRTHVDDISLLYPVFNTNLSLQIPSRNIDKQGAFDIFYWYEQIINKNYYYLSPYDTYLYACNQVVNIQNNLINDRKKVLLITDSFGQVVAPFLALGIENIEMLDLRQSVNGYSGSVKTYIKQTKPDMVIVMYNPSAIALHEDAFDFR
jgi:hypothetical protein